MTTAPSRSLARYLVCPPDFYQVSYAINPWMKPQVWQAETDYWTRRSRDQWQRLTDLMKSLGWILETIAPQPDLPDMVFSANHAVVIGKKALVARFAKAQREGETPWAQQWFQSHGFETKICPVMFEGAGDALYDASLDVVFMGYGFRSIPEAAGEISSFFGKKVVPLQLRDPRFYHLDTCYCPIDGGKAIFTPLAFTDEAQATLRRQYGDRLIEIPEEDALQFACNAINAGRDIVVPKISARTQILLQDNGLIPHMVELDSFILAGGASKCLTLRLDVGSGIP
ncbi:MAG: arginine deiminase-related protein [Pseudomonadota bacterium]|nr:arginine deiminase-related protein [Pseudomonadota bacterium]